LQVVEGVVENVAVEEEQVVIGQAHYLFLVAQRIM
jgi:hypothetical protein